MFGKKNRSNGDTDSGASEETFVAQALNKLSSNAKASKEIKRALGGRRASDLSERELMTILDRAIAAAAQ